MMKDVTNTADQAGGNKSLSWKVHVGLYLLLLVFALLYYYIFLPPFHYASTEFWFFLLLLTLGVVVIELAFDIVGQTRQVYRRFFSRKYSAQPVQLKAGRRHKYQLIFSFWGLVLLVWLGVEAVCNPFFMSGRFANMIQVREENFQEDFPETNVNEIPLIDRETAQLLGDRRLGELSELVSQFEAAKDYTQINIQGHPYRVSPLEYAGLFKWLNNYKKGIPHYIQVNMVSGEADLIDLDQPMKYTNSDHFNRNAKRKLRFRYPFTLFGSPSFEVDDSGHPYYVATTYRRRFVLKEPEASGVVLLDAVTGETSYCQLDQLPQWIDRVYSADLILHQLKMRGKYQGGFWNSVFAKRGVTEPTEGYNYLPMQDDIYLYTGITSVVSDASNIGFVLVNMRTKEATMYPLTAAEEYSAMRSAEGSVQEKGYKATFPLLINLKGRPLYILSLKDQAGLIKQYALIDVSNYQNVLVASSVSELIHHYSDQEQLNFEEITGTEGLTTVTGRVRAIAPAVVNGNSTYFIQLEGEIYQVPVQLNDQLPFLKADTPVELRIDANGRVQAFKVVE